MVQWTGTDIISSNGAGVKTFVAGFRYAVSDRLEAVFPSGFFGINPFVFGTLSVPRYRAKNGHVDSYYRGNIRTRSNSITRRAGTYTRKIKGSLCF